MNERRTSISTVRPAASDGDFYHDLIAVCTCRAGAARTIAAARASDHRCIVSGSDRELPGLSDLHPKSGCGGLARYAADANVRLGNRGGDSGNVDGALALV